MKALDSKTLICECRCALLYDIDEGSVVCCNSNCEYHGVKYKIPDVMYIELEELDEKD